MLSFGKVNVTTLTVDNPLYVLFPRQQLTFFLNRQSMLGKENHFLRPKILVLLTVFLKANQIDESGNGAMLKLFFCSTFK